MSAQATITPNPPTVAPGGTVDLQLALADPDLQVTVQALQGGTLLIGSTIVAVHPSLNWVTSSPGPNDVLLQVVDAAGNPAGSVTLTSQTDATWTAPATV